jgi:hypothetical protein
MAKTLCGFCESSTEKITNEHVFGEWIGRLFGAGRPELIVRNTLKRDATALRPWHNYRLDQRVRMACKRCNNTWMNDLENKVKPIISPMILGSHSRKLLTRREQLIIATWAVKTVMVVEFLHRESSARYFTQDERRSLMSDAVPSRSTGAYVWLGRYDSKNDGVRGLAGSMTYADRLPRAHGSLFAVGQLAIQILVERSAVGQRDRLATRPGPWDQMLSQIWPPPSIFETNDPLLPWPPPVAITDQTFDATFDRFLALGAQRGPYRPNSTV